MKFVGHTMAIPGMDICEGIRLMKRVGMDAIELVAQEGTPFHIDLPDAEIERIVAAARECGLEIATLTPYFWDIDSADPAVARAQADGLTRAVRLASRMGARFVRAYGGKDKAEGSDEEKRERSVRALRQAGEAARELGVTVVIENHPGTITRTGRATRELVDAVNMPSVRALYDPCNVYYDTNEDWLTTLNSQLGTIAYVHCKDYLLDDQGARRACVVGEGIVPWLEILRRLKWDGYLCFEYEKRWYPDQLEDAETGLVKCKNYVAEAIKA